MSSERPPLAGFLARGLFVCNLVAGAGIANADESSDELPDMAFLEYLGSWQESDEDWLILNDADILLGKQDFDVPELGRNDPAPDGEASTENDHEE